MERIDHFHDIASFSKQSVPEHMKEFSRTYKTPHANADISALDRARKAYHQLKNKSFRIKSNILGIDVVCPLQSLRIVHAMQ